MGVGKPRGLRAGRKLKDHRRNNRYIIIIQFIIDGQINPTTKP